MFDFFVIVASDYSLFASVCPFICLYVFLSICPGVFSDTINARVTMSHIFLRYVPGQKPIEFGVN